MVKTIFIGAEAEVEVIPVLKKALDILPEKVGIVTTAQHLSKIDEAKKFLEQNKKKVVLGGQVLGCNVMNAEKIAEKVDCILFIGSGRFHPIEIGKVKRIITANPFTNEINEIGELEIKKIGLKRKVAITRFLSSDKIGVISSTKKGQSAAVDMKKLEKKYPEKKFFYFACDTLAMNDLENFPFIECWVNTMCPRIAYEDVSEKPIVNLEDI